MHVSLIRPFRRSAVALAACAALFAPALSAAPFVRLVGPQSPFTLVVADAPALIAKWGQSPFARTWADPEVERFFAPLHAKLAESEWQKEVQEATGRTPAELLGLLQGELLFSIPDSEWIVTDGSAVEPRVLFAAQIGKNQAEIERLVGLMVQHNLVDSATREIGGRTVNVLTAKPDADAEADADADATTADDSAVEGEDDASEDDAPATNPFKETLWVIVDGQLLVSSQETTLAHALRVLGGEALPSLADSDDFAVTTRRAADSDVLMHMDLTWIHPLAMAAAEKEAASGAQNAMGMQPTAIVSALGLDALRSLYVGMTIGDTRTDSHGGLRYTEKKGILKLLALSPGPVERPAFIPSQWISAGVFKFSVPEMYRAIFEILDAANPMISGMAQGQIRNLNRQLGVDLENDLIGSLGDVLVSGVTLPPGGVAAPVAPGAMPFQQVFGLSLKNREAFTRAIAALRTMAGPAAEQALRERDYLGHTIVEIVTPTPPPPDGESAPAPAAPQVAYAITDGWLLISTGGTHPLESALQGLQQKGTGFWDRAEVKKLLADAPADAAGVQYEDTRRTISALFPFFAQAFGQAAAMSGEDSMIDPSAVPSSDTIGKYWGDGGGYITIEADGMHSSSIVTYPAP